MGFAISLNYLSCEAIILNRSRDQRLQSLCPLLPVRNEVRKCSKATLHLLSQMLKSTKIAKEFSGPSCHFTSSNNTRPQVGSHQQPPRQSEVVHYHNCHAVTRKRNNIIGDSGYAGVRLFVLVRCREDKFTGDRYC
jgi:hypothetical protein